MQNLNATNYHNASICTKSKINFPLKFINTAIFCFSGSTNVKPDECYEMSATFELTFDRMPHCNIPENEKQHCATRLNLARIRPRLN